MIRIFIASLFAAALSATASPASAHARLSASSPKAGSIISAPPTLIQLNFTEGLEPAFSGLQVIGPKGRTLALGAPEISGKTMSIRIATPLSAGRYVVKWRATSVDTHKTEGRFAFSVKP